MAAKKKPNARQRAFVKEYVWGEHCGNGGKCMHLAGFTVKDVCSGAYQLLRRPAVKAAIEAELTKKEELIKLKALRVAEETYAQATANLTDALDDKGALRPISEWPADLRRALAAVEVEQLAGASGASGTADDGDFERAPSGTVVKIKLHDKRASQELFLKWAGKLKDKIELDGTPLTFAILPALAKPAPPKEP